MLRDALHGTKVLDFTHIGAGPTCAMLLGDMGARVIKIEPIDGDMGRRLGPPWIGSDSALFHGFNRNKLGVAIDLKHPKGRDTALRLAENADVIVESMRPGVMSRLGLGYDDVARINPGLVYCSLSAYGQGGPYAERPGVDGILQADSGLMSIIGNPGGEPVKVQAPVVDVFSGYTAALGVVARLLKRASDGTGGHLDASLFNSAIALQQSALTMFLADGEVPERLGSAAPYSAPNEAFETAEGWIMVAAFTPDRWADLCALLGCPELIADARFSTSPLRVANRPQMRAALTPYFKRKSAAAWLAAFQAADILCAPVSDYATLLAHPQLHANAMIVTVEHPAFGAIRQPGFPIDSCEANKRGHRPAPGIGEHSIEILADAGFSAAEIETLLNERVIKGKDDLHDDESNA